MGHSPLTFTPEKSSEVFSTQGASAQVVSSAPKWGEGKILILILNYQIHSL